MSSPKGENLSAQRKLFFVVFCCASILQGAYSSYFVSILTTIEQIYQIPSKTAGLIMSASEVGQILGSIVIAYYGGRGNRLRWMSLCMTLTALAAIISILPILLETRSHDSAKTDASTSPRALDSELALRKLVAESTSPSTANLCLHLDDQPLAMNSTHDNPDAIALAAASSDIRYHHNRASTKETRISGLSVFFSSLLVIGLGSTALSTLGIPFIDDMVSKEDSPLYLAITIGLKILGPALGFILGSICINIKGRVDYNPLEQPTSSIAALAYSSSESQPSAWWLGPIIISVPLLLLAVPMFYLSRSGLQQFGRSKQKTRDGIDINSEDLNEVTYQAAEDREDSRDEDFHANIIELTDNAEVNSNHRTCFSDINSASCERLQPKSTYYIDSIGKRLVLNQPVTAKDALLSGFQCISPTSGVDLCDHKHEQSKALIVAHLPVETTADSLCEPAWSTAKSLVLKPFRKLTSEHIGQPHLGRQNIASDVTSINSGEAINHDNISTEIIGNRKFVRLPPSSSRSSATSSFATDLGGTPQDSKQITRTISRLCRNKLLMLRLLSGVLHILPIAGFYTFLPKYLTEHFRIASSSASAISGLAGILFVGLGAFSGGLVIRVTNINSNRMTRWISLSALFYCLGMLVLMQLGCPSGRLIHYTASDAPATDCQLSCNCKPNVYEPVCMGTSTYISPCLAGCKTHSRDISGKSIYSDCASCPDRLKPLQPHNNMTSPRKDSMTDTNKSTGSAIGGHCKANCSNLMPYIIVFSLMTLLHSSSEVGAVMFNLRCVEPDQRTMAIGLSTFSISLLGSIPCSIIYGSIIDMTCVHWDWFGWTDGSRLEQQQGACQAYNNDVFRIYLHGVTAAFMFLAFLIDCIIVRSSHKVDFYGNDEKETYNQGTVT